MESEDYPFYVFNLIQATVIIKFENETYSQILRLNLVFYEIRFWVQF